MAEFNHTIVRDRKGFLENINTVLNISPVFVIQIAGQIIPRQLKLFEPPVNADFIKDIPQVVL